MAQDADPRPFAKAADDFVLPFRVERADASGRIVRLGTGIDEILMRHAYPDEVSRILGEALLLVAMFGTTIKERQDATSATAHSANPRSERFILQTQTDGPISMIVADYHHPGDLRGYARFDEARLAATRIDAADPGALLGKGHLAMTVDRGGDTDRYQGIVAIDNDGLAAAADHYFEQSEQLPTFIQLAIARHFDGDASAGTGWRWRGGGLMVQKLTPVGGFAAASDEPAADTAAASAAPDDDGWNRAYILASSLKDHELSDPMISSQEVLVRLFHEDGVRVFPATPVKAGCGCSHERVALMLASFSTEERRDMAEPDGRIHITCEFCNRHYDIAAND